MTPDAGAPTEAGAPSARALAAQRRAEQLRLRHHELAEGTPVTEDTVRAARERAEESVNRAKAAHRAASTRHQEAERAHRNAAAAHEQAALRVDGIRGEAHQDAAEQHRDAADIHHTAAEVQYQEYITADERHPTPSPPSTEARR